MMRFVSMSEGAEVLQHFQAGFAGFFRMELHAEEMIAFHCGGELATVFAAGHRRIRDWGAKGVGEVHE